MDFIEINTFDFETIKGFKINHQKDLPKKAFLHKYTYDNEFNCYSIYLCIGKKGTKQFLLKNKT